MKKILMALMMILSFVGVASADDYAHDASVLPEAAKSVLKKNFKSGVSVVKIDKDFGRVSEYEVVMTDGSEVTFDSKGNWKDVEVCRDKAVPAGFVLKPISDYVSKNHKGMKIVGIEKERSGYDVQLSNGIEMKFSAAGKFRRYDD